MEPRGASSNSSSRTRSLGDDCGGEGKNSVRAGTCLVPSSADAYAETRSLFPREKFYRGTLACGKTSKGWKRSERSLTNRQFEVVESGDGISG